MRISTQYQITLELSNLVCKYKDRTIWNERDMGRKPTVKGGKLHVLNMRTTQDLRDKLEAAAKANGRSLSAEAEERLILSFAGHDEIFGDRKLYQLMSMMAMGIRVIEGTAGKSWRDDHATRLKIEAMAPQMIRLMAAPGPKKDYTNKEVDKAVEDAGAFMDAVREWIKRKAEEAGITAEAATDRIYSPPPRKKGKEK
jgi:hypothetical protein